MDPKKDDQSSETKPWDQSFGDDRDEQGNLSRTKRHRQSHNNRLITIILVAIIIIIAVGSLIYGLARQSAMNKPDHSMSVSSEQTSSVSQSHKKAAKSASEKAASSVSEKKASADSSSKSQRTSTDNTADSNTTSASQTQQTSESATAKQPATATKPAKSAASHHTASSAAGSKYAVVGQGQGIYRVAVNNGISVERLKQLNPGVQTLKPGQKLRVK